MTVRIFIFYFYCCLFLSFFLFSPFVVVVVVVVIFCYVSFTVSEVKLFVRRGGGVLFFPTV